ncbi:type I CRISPR-associated protein Cas7 [Alkaliphilus hydrothermalis]|uniref:CRISPR-associated protein Csh2 n=1 Tax=Alkaliphilus hydrothermalis TaxID=1482730 RepID=A0ABS2NNI1_9FIRM|nr:type I CRISPR-associated protein Cas7 [Alkaliphilus hydrothermalis]MBM7614505.1 CRISPR-associated protein Csh2 [Alkaliphilus hydrothermalis]
MNKRVYGVLGIVSRMSNWNADFTGYPKTTSNGDVFGSDKAFKYPIKKMWEQQGKKVLYIKSMKFNEPKKGETELIPRSLKERYEYIFDVEDLKKDKDTRNVITNLFTAVDVKNFGATFAEEGNNISITGAVQIGQGFNKYDETHAEEQQILSPFRDASKKEGKNNEDKEEAKSSTLGTKIVSDEAHYFYPFAINPTVYDEFKSLDLTEGYTEEDYMSFKKASLVAATSFSTNAKLGCENEFALFIETEIDLYLPDLSQYITFEKREGKNIITINCDELLNELQERIYNIEIYYNPYTTTVETAIKGAKKYNIFTLKEV